MPKSARPLPLSCFFSTAHCYLFICVIYLWKRSLFAIHPIWPCLVCLPTAFLLHYPLYSVCLPSLTLCPLISVLFSALVKSVVQWCWSSAITARLSSCWAVVVDHLFCSAAAATSRSAGSLNHRHQRSSSSRSTSPVRPISSASDHHHHHHHQPRHCHPHQVRMATIY